jgi:hypothetical protein
LTQARKTPKYRRMNKQAICAAVILALAACGEQAPKQSSPPVRVACTTPEQAGQRAQDITHKLVEARKQGKITPEEYAALNNTMSNGFRDWADRQDLKAYCATLDRVVKDAGL